VPPCATAAWCRLAFNPASAQFPFVWCDNVYATQFHPEKSRKVGLQLLKYFVELAQP
jgi:imidazoleglycerol phosphate synthase glutamine amidotransferase subunit HisH